MDFNEYKKLSQVERNNLEATTTDREDLVILEELKKQFEIEKKNEIDAFKNDNGKIGQIIESVNLENPETVESIKKEIGLDAKLNELDNEAEKLMNNQEEVEDLLDLEIKKEIDPILEVLCPKGEDVMKYSERIKDEIFGDVEKINMTKGIMYQAPEELVLSVKKLLISRCETALIDAVQDYEKKNIQFNLNENNERNNFLSKISAAFLIAGENYPKEYVKYYNFQNNLSKVIRDNIKPITIRDIENKDFKSIKERLEAMHKTLDPIKEGSYIAYALPLEGHGLGYRLEIQEKITLGEMPYGVFDSNQVALENSEILKCLIPEEHYKRKALTRLFRSGELRKKSAEDFFSDQEKDLFLKLKEYNSLNNRGAEVEYIENLNTEELNSLINFVKSYEKNNFYQLDNYSRGELIRLFDLNDFENLLKTQQIHLSDFAPDKLLQLFEKDESIKEFFLNQWKNGILNHSLDFKNSGRGGVSEGENGKIVFSFFTSTDLQDFIENNVSLDIDLISDEQINDLLLSTEIKQSTKDKFKELIRRNFMKTITRDQDPYLSRKSRSLITNNVFPEELLEDQEIKSEGFSALQTIFSAADKHYAYSMNLAEVTNILTLVPIEKEKLHTEEFRNSAEVYLNNGLKNVNFYDIKEMEKCLNNINLIKEYIPLPDYFSEKSLAINEIKKLSLDNDIETIIAKIIMRSEIPMSIVDESVQVINKARQVLSSDLHKDILNRIILTSQEHKGQMDHIITYSKEMLQFVSQNFLNKNWDYLYKHFSDESNSRLEAHKKLLNRVEPFANSAFFKGMTFPQIFNFLSTLSSEEQNKAFELLNTQSLLHPEASPDKWAENIIIYINDNEDMQLVPADVQRKATINDIFYSQYKDIALSKMQTEWIMYLSGEQSLPISLFLLGKLIDDAGGAGNMKHIESLGNLIYEVDIAEKPKTIDRTKQEVKTLLLSQEERFKKEKWSQDEISEFYNLSKDMLEAAPSLYSTFAPVFQNISQREMKMFMSEVFPFYQAELVIMQTINGDDVTYNSRNLVTMRQSVRSFSEKLKNESKTRADIFTAEKTRLLEIIKSSFQERFGLLKVPQEFTKEHLRSIQNAIRYMGNINGRNPQREAVITLYLGLELNNQWGAFRGGQEIDVSEYLSENQLQLIKPLIDEKKKGYESMANISGVSMDKMPEFQKILQEDTMSSLMGSIQTIDVKLGNIKRNIDELGDLDIYENVQDKNILKLLTKEGKSVGTILAKLYGIVSGKQIIFSPEEKELQEKIENTFGVQNWDTVKIKQIQDQIQPFSLVVNMINKMKEEKVDENITELQKRLVPNEIIIDIFKRLGEEFNQESGALALSKDLTYLESLIVKDSDKITDEERVIVKEYIESIREKMKDLEKVSDQVKQYFDKIKRSVHLDNHELLKNRLEEVEKIIYSTDTNAMITSHMTKDLNLIIENMRQCLGCMRKEANNDTNLAFGDYNKFFMINRGEKDKGSISDEIVFFLPVTLPNGKQEMSFVMDQVYGSKSSDVLVGNILSVYKKYQALKEQNPNASLSISVTKSAMSSVGLTAEILEKRLAEVIKNKVTIETGEEFIATIPKSSFSDNYIEFGNGGARQTGDRTFGGLVIR